MAAALAPDGRHLLVALETWGARNPSLVALDTRSWSPVWSRPLIDRGVEMVFEGSAVYVGSYNRSSFDVAMYCLDVASGAGQWTADVRGIVVEHMAYWNEIRLFRREGWVAVVGCAAAGDYVETFDARTGAAIARWRSARGLE